MYLERQRPEDIEDCTWIGTDLKLFIGVGHSVHLSDMPFFINEGSVEITPFLQSLKGSDRLCKVVELSMQSCGNIL